MSLGPDCLSAWRQNATPAEACLVRSRTSRGRTWPGVLAARVSCHRSCTRRSLGLAELGDTTMLRPHTTRIRLWLSLRVALTMRLALPPTSRVRQCTVGASAKDICTFGDTVIGSLTAGESSLTALAALPCVWIVCAPCGTAVSVLLAIDKSHRPTDRYYQVSTRRR